MLPLLFERDFYNSQKHMLVMTILGTLSNVGIIDICTYERVYSKENKYKGLKLTYLPKTENKSLHVASNYFKTIALA